MSRDVSEVRIEQEPGPFVPVIDRTRCEGARPVQKFIAADFRTNSRGNGDWKRWAGTSKCLRVMLPMTLRFLIAMIASAFKDRAQRKCVYLEEEVRVLKEQVETLSRGKKLTFTPEQRRRLAIAGKELTPKERKECCHLVKPETILAWFRQLAAGKYDSSQARRGCPGKHKDIRKLVIKLALDNPSWGYTKIRDALRTGLGIEIGRTTVANILVEAGIEPAPEREKKRTWKQFIKAHWDSFYACDFFTVETLGLTGTVRYMVFFVMQVKTRAVEIAGIQIAPGQEWMKQVARNLTDVVDGFLPSAAYLIHDRDPLFTKAFEDILENQGVKCVRIRRTVPIATHTRSDLSRP